MKDLYNSINPVMATAPVSISATATAVEVDLINCNSAVILWATGIEAGVLSESLGWTLTITHADDDGTGVAGSYSNVTSADLQGATAASGIVTTLDDPAEDATLYKIGYIGGKRFIKLLVSEVGSTTGMPHALIVIKGDLRDSPVIA